jgi:hypothetical protein
MIARQFMPLLYALQLLKFQYFQIGYFLGGVAPQWRGLQALHSKISQQGSWRAFDG